MSDFNELSDGARTVQEAVSGVKASGAPLRLLPWSGEGGKACYLRTDGETSTSLTRLADNLESVQLGMAETLLGYVDEALWDKDPSETELRSVVASLCRALRDVVRVAECRGGRLPELPGDDPASRAADAVIDREIIR
jgi:hypothetical protein